jgi:predicted ester cyclase
MTMLVLPAQAAECFKQLIGKSHSANLPLQYNIESMVADGDQVLAPFTMSGMYTGKSMGA